MRSKVQRAGIFTERNTYLIDVKNHPQKLLINLPFRLRRGASRSFATLSRRAICSRERVTFDDPSCERNTKKKIILPNAAGLFPLSAFSRYKRENWRDGRGGISRRNVSICSDTSRYGTINQRDYRRRRRRHHQGRKISAKREKVSAISREHLSPFRLSEIVRKIATTLSISGHPAPARFL